MYDRTYYINSEAQNKKELLRLFFKNEKLVIFDIGGCEGEDSIKYSKLFPNATIYIFEPLPNNIERINQNIKIYNVNKVKIFPYALSDNIGLSEFHVSSGQPYETDTNLDWDFGNKSSSLLTPAEVKQTTPWLKFNEIISVYTETIEKFVEMNSISIIDFIHMDVQGAELKVLTGANSFIQNIKAVWLEVSNQELYEGQPKRGDIEKYMNSHNFILIKSEFNGPNGDQLYLNKNYFRVFSILGFFYAIKRKKYRCAK
jgi:FkbM family methyltransferase